MSERRTLRQNLRELPPAAWVLFAGTFINRFGSFVMTFLILYLTRRGFSAQEAGAAVSLYGLGGVVASIVGGELTDRIGRSRTITISMFASAAVMIALSQVNLLPIILVLTALAGLASEAYRPASSALLADLVPAGQRVAAFAALRFVLNAAFALGAATAGLLAQRSFFLLFVADAATSVVFGLLAIVAIHDVHAARPATEHRGVGGYRAVITDRVFLIFLIAMLLVAFVYLQSYTTFSLQVRALGFSAAVYGGLIALNGLLIVLLELPLTAWTQHRAPRPVIAGGFLLVGIGFSLVAVAHVLPLLVLAVLIWTLGEMLNSPMAGAYVADRAPAHLRGRYQGAWGLSWGVALILGPVIGTSLFAWNPSGFWLICGLLASIGAALVLLSGRLRGASARPGS
jgi:MFS family permease